MQAARLNLIQEITLTEWVEQFPNRKALKRRVPRPEPIEALRLEARPLPEIVPDGAVGVVGSEDQDEPQPAGAA